MREASPVTSLPGMKTDDVKNRALDLLKKYGKAEAEARTPITKQLAATIVDARERFQDADGNPDWNGKTYAYRRWLKDVFDEAHMTGEDASRAQAAIRYHVGGVLRARLTPEQLEDAGLLPQSPRERSHDRRQQRTAVLNALNAREVAGGALLALTAMSQIAQRIDGDELAGLSGSERDLAEASLADLERRVKALRRRMR